MIAPQATTALPRLALMVVVLPVLSATPLRAESGAKIPEGLTYHDVLFFWLFAVFSTN